MSGPDGNSADTVEGNGVVEAAVDVVKVGGGSGPDGTKVADTSAEVQCRGRGKEGIAVDGREGNDTREGVGIEVVAGRAEGAGGVGAGDVQTGIEKLDQVMAVLRQGGWRGWELVVARLMVSGPVVLIGLLQEVAPPAWIGTVPAALMA